MSETSIARKSNTKHNVWSLISLCFIFLFGKIVPPFAGITPVGMGILGVFFGVLIATITTNEIFWPAIFGLFGMVVCGFTTAPALLSTWIWIVLFATLCFMRDRQGKPFVDGVKILQSKTMWGIVAVAGCFTIAGGAIASDTLGIKAAIATALSPVLNNASWPIMVVLCVVVSTVFTNFTNGMPVSFTINAICIPLACTMQLAGVGNATVLGSVTIMANMCAFITNGAIAYAPILLGREEITQKFIWTKGIVTNVIFIVVTCVIGIVFGYIF